jgi:hypothetical protein
MANFNLANRIKIVNPSANVDVDYGPYNSLNDAKTAVLEVIREKGKTVGVIESGSVVEYWWKDGIGDGDLVEKTSGGGGTASGENIKKEINQTSHGFSVGDFIGWSGGTYNKAIADGLYDGEFIGLVSDVESTDIFKVVQAGYVTGLTSLVADTTYFLSPTTAGLITTDEPTGNTQISKTVLIADSSTTGWILPYAGYVITTGTSSGGGIWGTIKGTLSDQDDLLDELDLKAPIESPTFTGTVTLPSTTSIGNISSTEISYLDGLTQNVEIKLNTIGGNNIDTWGNDVDFNVITYDKYKNLTIQGVRTDNYTGQTNTPFLGYGSLITFNGEGLFPLQIAADYTGQLYYRSKYIESINPYNYSGVAYKKLANTESPTFTGSVGIGTTTTPTNILQVVGSHSDGNIEARGNTPTDGYIRLTQGDNDNAGYISWYRGGNAARIGYMGYDNNNISVCAENGANLIIGGGDIHFEQGTSRTICVAQATDGGAGDNLYLCAGTSDDHTNGTAYKGGCLNLFAGRGSSEQYAAGAGGDVYICGGAGGNSDCCYVGQVGGNVIINGGSGGEGFAYCGGSNVAGTVQLQYGGITTLNIDSEGAYVTGRLYTTACVIASTCVSTLVSRATTCMQSSIYCATTCFTVTGTGARYCGGTGYGTATDWIATSDCRVKKNIEPITNALSKIECLCGVCYEFCEDGTPDMGLIAQDVYCVEPRLVSSDDAPEEYKKYGIDDQMLGLKYDKFAGLFVEAIKELQQQNIDLQLQIMELKNKLNHE